MTGRLDSKVIIVTGGSAGMGRALAIRAAAEGAKVVIAARDKQRGEAVVREIETAGGEALFVSTDVTVEEDLAALVSATTGQFGRLDGAFNNAGGGETMSSVRTMDNAAWHNTLDLNLTSLFYSLKYEIPAMLASGGGSIVNNASVAGVGADPLMHAYHAAKHGAVGLTKSVALELAQQNIRVNALITGVIDTPLYRQGIAADPGLADYLHGRIPMGRVGKEEEVAGLVAFLLGDEVTYITGAALAIDGGITAR